MGGLYADVDTECRRPMDEIIKPRDTLLVGWENEFATPEIAAHRNYARTRQVLQWVFAAAPGHPALREICDHIAQNVYTQFSQNTNRDTLERTGPGVFTDYVLKHAAMHPPSKVSTCKTSKRLCVCHHHQKLKRLAIAQHVTLGCCKGACKGKHLTSHSCHPALLIANAACSAVLLRA